MNLPPEQEAIRAKCFHPSGMFVEFPIEDVETSIPERFKKIAKMYPDRIAVSIPSETLTFDQLNRRANRLAHAIISRFGSNQEPVGLMLGQGLPLVVAVLGVLKAGKIYVLIDPYYPAERINYLLNHAQVQLVIRYGILPIAEHELVCTGRQFFDLNSLDRINSEHDPKVVIAPESLAAIHYTSGSTGEPKGVMQTHQKELHRVSYETAINKICSEDRFTFPASRGGQMFSALLNGASVYPADIKDIGFNGLIRSLREDRLTIFISVTSTFRYLLHSLNNDQTFPHLRLIKLIGEPLYKNDIELYKKHFFPQCIVINRLGSNETETFCENFVDGESPLEDNVISVGFPRDDVEVSLIDEFGDEVADGEIGEFAVIGI